MESLETLYIQVLSFGILILVAYFMGKVTDYLHIGELVGQLLGGILVNPYLIRLIHIEHQEYTLAFRKFYFFTFIFLSLVAFSLGEELHLTKLKQVGLPGIIICTGQILTTFVCVTVGFLLYGYDPFIALIVGSMSLTTSHAATFVITNKLRIEGALQEILASIIMLDEVIEVLLFSFMIQLASEHQYGRAVSIPAASWHALEKVGVTLGLGILTFLLLKLIIRESPPLTPATSAVPQPSFRLRDVFREHPAEPVPVMILVVGLLSLAVSVAIKFHLPFILVPLVAGAGIANFHTRTLFESLKREDLSSFFNLLFFALIGANINLGAVHQETLGYVLLYIVTRSVGKLAGTWIGTRITHQDLKIQRCLPRLMLPQAGVAVIEAAYVALVLNNGELVMNIILPALIFFEITGVILSEKTLRQWKSWIVGEEAYLHPPSEAETQPQPIIPVAASLNLKQLLSDRVIKIPLASTTKEGILWELLEVLNTAGKISNIQQVFQDILSREVLMSTGIGDGIALPHGRTTAASSVACVFGSKPGGVDFQSLDGQPADLFFLIVSPEDAQTQHLQVLAAISQLLQRTEYRQRLRRCASPQDAMAFFMLAETTPPPGAEPIVSSGEKPQIQEF